MKEFVRKIQNREIDISQNTSKAVSRCKDIGAEYHYFNIISEAPEQCRNPEGKLAGIPIAVKDCICVKGMESRAGSAILNGYKPLFNATVIEKIIAEGGIIIGKTSQDEFGFGSFNVNVGSGFEVPLNPHDKKRTTGGSSGGSCGIAAKAGFPLLSLGESTGGSIACPAAFCGVVGLTPTYGRVSRYGNMDYANSLDKIGAIGKTVYDASLLLEVIAGKDEFDSTCSPKPAEKYSESVGKGVKGLKVGIIKESFGEGTDQHVQDDVWREIKKLEDSGITYEEVSLPLTSRYGISAYYLIAMAEASTNLARYCGMRYGKHEALHGNYNEYFSKVRSKNFSDEAKRRIMLGTFARMAGFRDAYYLKATKVRTKIIEEYARLFEAYDALASPSMPITAPTFDEIGRLTPLQNYMMDILTVGPNLAGLPHISVPCGSGKLPAGIMLIASHFNESKIIQLGSAL